MAEKTPVPFKQYFPKLSLRAYFWLVIFVCLVVFGVLGYFVGLRVSQLPPSQQQASVPVIQGQASVTPGVIINDDAYSNISGNLITQTTIYDQIVLQIKAVPGKTTTYNDFDQRTFNLPHVRIPYPYVFSRLHPFESYVVSASACFTNKKTFALVCAKNITITKCTGIIQGDTCIIKGNGNDVLSSGQVDFLVPKPAGVAN